MVRRGKEGDEVLESVWPNLRRMNTVTPVKQGCGVHPSQIQPAVDVVEGDGKIGGVVRDVAGNALPAEDTVLAAEMVIVDCLI